MLHFYKTAGSGPVPRETEPAALPAGGKNTARKAVYAVILPVCNEEACLGTVLDELVAATEDGGADMILAIGLNGTTDRSGEIAAGRGAFVGESAERGYGHGCLAAIERLAEEGIEPDAYIIFSGDGADKPEDVLRLIDAYRKGADLVIGNRTLIPSNWKYQGSRRAFPNVTLAAMTTLLTGRMFFDLGPLRLIDRVLFEKMEMREMTWGWTVEAQIMAARYGARIRNIHVEERPRLAGEQKVSGVHWRRSLKIGFAILAAAWRVRWRRMGRMKDEG